MLLEVASGRNSPSSDRPVPLVMSEAGPVAWVAGRATVRARVDGQDVTLTGRFSAVLEYRDGRWLLVQTHFSLPAAD